MRIWQDLDASLYPELIMKVEAAAAETHTETRRSADVPNVPMTTTDPGLWLLDSQHPALSKTEATLDWMTYATIKIIGVITTITIETVETTTETIVMIDTTLTATTTKEETGANWDSTNEKSESC